MKNISNYIYINENISTSGQPSAIEFEQISNEGFEVVINLSSFNSEDQLSNQDNIVSSLGMSYIHIPVDFENPSEDNLFIFLQLLESLEKRKVWIHCIKNYRVSAFMYVYHKYFLKTPFDKIDLSIFEEWSPNEKWQKLMKIEI